MSGFGFYAERRGGAMLPLVLVGLSVFVVLLGLMSLALKSEPVDVAPQEFRLPFDGHATWSTYSGHRPSEGRDVFPQSPDAWDGTVLAALGGTVIFASNVGKCGAGGYGNVLVLEHLIDGTHYRSIYAHLSEFYVGPGDTPAKGAAIGFYGSTGCSTENHLHFEVRQGSLGSTAFKGAPANVDHISGVNVVGSSGCCGGAAIGPSVNTGTADDPDTDGDRLARSRP